MDDSGDELRNFENNINNLSKHVDAHIAVTLGASLEGMLEEALIRKMQPINNEMRKRLFEGYGPLSGFAAKMDLAYALKIISRDMYNSLRIVKKIRDLFAHRREFTDFQTPEIAILLDKLGLDMTLSSMRTRYMVRLARLRGILGRLDQPALNGS